MTITPMADQISVSKLGIGVRRACVCFCGVALSSALSMSGCVDSSRSEAAKASPVSSTVEFAESPGEQLNPILRFVELAALGERHEDTRYGVFSVKLRANKTLALRGVLSPAGFVVGQPAARIDRWVDGGWQSPFLVAGSWITPPDSKRLTSAAAGTVLIEFPSPMFDAPTETRWRVCVVPDEGGEICSAEFVLPR